MRSLIRPRAVAHNVVEHSYLDTLALRVGARLYGWAERRIDRALECTCDDDWTRCPHVKFPAVDD